MTTIAEVVGGFRELIRQTSDDTSFTDEFLYYWLNNSRAVLLKQQLSSNKTISDWLYQRFCIKLCPSSFIECGCEELDFGCNVYRSDKPIPKPMTVVNDLLYVSYLQGKRINQINENASRFIKYAKYKVDFYFMIGDVKGEKYLFIIQTDKTKLPPKYLKIQMIAEDPSQIEYSACNEEGCINFYDSGFPIDLHNVNAMYKMALEMISPALRIPEDISNNSDSSGKVNGDIAPKQQRGDEE